MIKLTQLDKYFFKNKKNQIHVLNDVSLTIEAKGLVAIHGPSGSGKTTLLNVIGGLDKVHSGKIEFFEHNIGRYSARVWDQIRNEHIGYVFQNYYLLPELSVYENVRFVLKILGVTDEEYIESRVHYVLKAVGMYPFRKKKALQLSGGQQQRVAIARALVKNPKVVIADEPTGNLDSKNTLEIMNIIKEIAREKLVILVTHEETLANVYADRIIEIEDGKIVGDHKNNLKSDHDIDDDETIYLKDIAHQESLENENVKLNLYLDEANEEQFDIKLIVKNKTLYLDIKSSYEKHIIADQSSGVVIKDEHYKKKSKAELQQTSFKTDDIDHSKIRKDKRMILSFKQTFKMAFEKLRTLGRRGKLMLASFFVAGMITAFAIASLAAVAIIRVEEFVDFPEGYIEFDADQITLDDLAVLKAEDDTLYINPYYPQAVNLLNADGSYGAYFAGQIDTIEHSKKYKLTSGRYATKDNEIVISQGLALNFLKSSAAQDFGIWNSNQLYKEKIYFGNQEAKVVGIVETNSKIIFASEVFAIFISSGPEKPIEAYTDVVTFGSTPAANQQVVSERALIEVGFPNLADVNFPLTYGDFVISGTHNLEDSNIVLIKQEEVFKKLVSNRQTYQIYTSKPKTIIELVKTNFNRDATDVYKQAKEQRKAELRVQLIASLTSTLILIGVSLLGFYFVIRSSLIERIYEVSVYRALGVRKKDISRSFLVEIFTITTITSLFGFLFMTYFLAKLQQGLFGELNLFYVNTFSTLIGTLLVYVLNFSAGILPIIFLLRKTPAQILSQYDI
ncbi:MAG: ABC transporter ATP-binding protein/permease [Acholeplasmataceae bacterium]|jgi:ABC-type lipoprotein export system ATPase subunit|nr:ABC transporter ATP-binding protein/permease [Acholeplasmataceae bacterium]